MTEIERALRQTIVHEFLGGGTMILDRVFAPLEVARLRERFAAVDGDGDGNITLSEADAFGSIVSAALLDEADVDSDGKLSFDELLMGAVSQRIQDHEDQLWQRFSACERDDQGRVTRQALSKVLDDAAALHGADEHLAYAELLRLELAHAFGPQR